MVRKKEQPYGKLRGVDLLLGNSIIDKQNQTADNESSSSSVDINLIIKPPSQPRRYFDRQALEQLKSSIEQHGILEPLLVRPLADGTYELVAGERRFRAALELKLTTVPVSIKSLTDLEAKQIALIENLQRVDLNPVEETEGILELLSIQLNQGVEEVVSLLYRMHNEAKGKVTQNVLGKNETEEVKSVFESLGLISWESFVTTRLPLLKLPSDILLVLREGKIAYTKAIALTKIKDEQQRKQLLKEAIELSLSLSQIKEKIKIVKEEEQHESKQITLKSRIDSVYKKIKISNAWADKSKRKKIERLLIQLENIVNN